MGRLYEFFFLKNSTRDAIGILLRSSGSEMNVHGQNLGLHIFEYFLRILKVQFALKDTLGLRYF